MVQCRGTAQGGSREQRLTDAGVEVRPWWVIVCPCIHSYQSTSHFRCHIKLHMCRSRPERLILPKHRTTSFPHKGFIDVNTRFQFGPNLPEDMPTELSYMQPIDWTSSIFQFSRCVMLRSELSSTTSASVTGPLHSRFRRHSSRAVFMVTGVLGLVVEVRPKASKVFRFTLAEHAMDCCRMLRSSDR